MSSEAGSLERAHLAELHALAAERGIAGYRLLRREELIAALRGEAEAPARPQRERVRLLAGPEAESEAGREEPTEDVTGVLELTPQRYGFIRLGGLGGGGEDVYISASQVRRCELREGDEVSGPARPPRRGERHRALVHVDRVNGAEPQLGRPRFEDLTAVAPSRRIALDRDPGDVLLRAVDLLAPLALGQRVLVRAAPRSGRTTLLRSIARAVAAGGEAEVIVLLVDERPEEVTAWREAVLASAPADMRPADQVRTARLALERARRRAESGAHAVLLVDSLSRLAVAAGTVAEVKRLFGSGRALAGEAAGSLTVVATVVAGADDGGAAERAVATTESALVTLAPELARAGVVPAL